MENGITRMSLHSVTQKRSHLTFEMKLLEHSRLAANKEAFFYRIGSAALLMLEVTSAKKGRGWCICNVIMLNPSLIGAWNSQLQSAWERAIEAELQSDNSRLTFIFHWHRTALLVTEESQEAWEEILSEQFASTIH
jgi:hypothetical protein